jgi:hypothetical protein
MPDYNCSIHELGVVFPARHCTCAVPPAARPARPPQFRNVHEDESAAPKSWFGNPFADDKAVLAYKGIRTPPASPAQAKRPRLGMFAAARIC